MSTDQGVVVQDAPRTVEPKPKRRSKLTEAEKAERQAARAIERERKKLETAERKAREKAQERLNKIAAAEGPHHQLPCVVMRNRGWGAPVVFPVKTEDIAGFLLPYTDAMCLDVEHSGYDFGHKDYELRTIQLGGKELAVVLDAADPEQLAQAQMALQTARKLHAHSATADLIPCVMAGLIGWDEAWDKMYDSVIYAKLTDPKMSESDANALKELARDMLGAFATAPDAERAKNELFRAMGCLIEVDALTPKERNGWYSVNKNAETMIRYAGTDVLDLAAVLEKLEPMLPVDVSVLDRERVTQTVCARVGWKGAALDEDHTGRKIAEYETLQVQSRTMVELMSGGLIINPSSPDVGEKLIELHPRLKNVLETSEKTGRPSAAKASLEKVKKTDPEYPLTSTILTYRHCTTTLGLLLRPLKTLCESGDGRMRPTILTINADTGRMSTVRPNSQQFSRRGGVRACVVADPGYRGISADFQGCEIRVAAALSGDRGLLEAETVKRCYLCTGIPCTCGKERYGLHWMAAIEAFGKDAAKEHRYMSKRIIFSKLFGGSAAAGARQVGIDIEDSQRIHNAFEALAPVYTAWDKWLRDCFYNGSFIWRDYSTGINYSSPVDGRRRAIYRTYSGRNIYSRAAHAVGNYAIQGTARELLVDGLLKWNDGPYSDSVLIPVHDEVIAFVKEDVAEEASRFLVECMTTSVLSVPGWDVEIGADPDEPFISWPDSS